MSGGLDFGLQSYVPPLPSPLLLQRRRGGSSRASGGRPGQSERRIHPAASVKSEGRRSKAERRPKEGRNPMAETRIALGRGFRPSDFGTRPSFGPRTSGFGLQSYLPLSSRGAEGDADAHQAGGDANRNAAFTRQPKCGSPGCRLNPAFRWRCQDAPRWGHISILTHPVQISLTPRFSGVRCACDGRKPF